MEDLMKKLIEAVIEGIKDTFKIMMSTEVSAEEPVQVKKMEAPKVDDPIFVRKGITGAIGFVGTLSGIFSVYFDEELSKKVASLMLGEDINEINEDVKSAVGEIANIAIGRAKTIMNAYGCRIEISPPTIIHGKSYMITPKVDEDRVLIPFKLPNGKDTFYVEVGIKR